MHIDRCTDDLVAQLVNGTLCVLLAFVFNHPMTIAHHPGDRDTKRRSA